MSEAVATPISGSAMHSGTAAHVLTGPARLAEAHRLVKHNAWWSAGAGLIPIPFADLAAVAGVQVNLVFRLAKLYGFSPEHDQTKAIVSGLIGGGVPFALSTGAVGSIAKSIPLIGSLAGIAVMPALSCAATLAIGRVFISHFESGGTLLDFNPAELREHYLKEFEAAKKEVGHGTHSAAPEHKAEAGRKPGRPEA